MAVRSWISPAEAGHLIRRARERKTLTQEQVAEHLGVDKSYVSKLEGGLHHAGRSKYFPQLVATLDLTPDEVRDLNPGAVIEVAPARKGPPVSPVVPFRETPISIPPELTAMVEQYGHQYPILNTERMQRMLAAPRAHGGLEVGPQTPEDWFDYWMANKRFLT